MEITELQKDGLVEFMNIGVGNATTAFSKLIGTTVKMNVSDVIIEKIEKVGTRLNASDEITTAILLKINGDAPGIMLISFSAQNALMLAGKLTNNHKKDIKIIDEIDRSAMKEAGNIITGALTSSLSKFLGLNMLQSIPDVATDMFSALLSSIVSEVGITSESILILRTSFSLEDNSLEGNLYLFFSPEASIKIIESIERIANG